MLKKISGWNKYGTIQAGIAKYYSKLQDHSTAFLQLEITFQQHCLSVAIWVTQACYYIDKCGAYTILLELPPCREAHLHQA